MHAHRTAIECEPENAASAATLPAHHSAALSCGKCPLALHKSRLCDVLGADHLPAAVAAEEVVLNVDVALVRVFLAACGHDMCLLAHVYAHFGTVRPQRSHFLDLQSRVAQSSGCPSAICCLSSTTNSLDKPVVVGVNSRHGQQWCTHTHGAPPSGVHKWCPQAARVNRRGPVEHSCALLRTSPVVLGSAVIV